KEGVGETGRSDGRTAGRPCCLTTYQGDRRNSEHDPYQREHTWAFAECDRGENGERDGDDGGDGRDDGHGADRERAIEQCDTDAACEARERAPPQIGAGGRRGRKQRDGQRDQHQSDCLRDENDRERRGAACGEAAGEIGRAIEAGREQREEVADPRYLLSSCWIGRHPMRMMWLSARAFRNSGLEMTSTSRWRQAAPQSSKFTVTARISASSCARCTNSSFTPGCRFLMMSR